MKRGSGLQKIRAANLRLLHQTHSWEEIASAVGTAPGYLSQIAAEVVGKGRKSPRALSDQMAEHIEKRLGLQSGWMDEEHAAAPGEDVTGVADMAGAYDAGAEREAIPGTVAIESTRSVPVVGNTQAGPNAYWMEQGHPAGFGDGYLDAPSNDDRAYALRVRGQSMSPRMREGEALLVEPSKEVGPGDEVIVCTTDGQVMVKELVYWRNGEIGLDSVADGHDRITLQQEEIEFIHLVAGIFRSSAVLKS